MGFYQDRRWLAVGQALLHEDYSADKVHQLSKIDKVNIVCLSLLHLLMRSKWFLYKLEGIAALQQELKDIGSLFGLRRELVQQAKKMGFSDKQIALCVGSTEDEVRARRKGFGVKPFVKKIDTLAAEFPAVCSVSAIKKVTLDTDLNAML